MIKIEICLPVGFKNEDILENCAKKLKISQKNIQNFEIIKLSVDARHKNSIKYQASIALELEGKLEEKYRDLKFELDRSLLIYNKKSLSLSPIIVGFGPSGMFAGLTLARMGLNPIILEQGEKVDKRKQDVEEFWYNRKLNPYSNVQFGEGGAGTFSDGKLNSNVNNIYCKKVLNEFYHFGAPKEILYLSKPHIGSDNLAKIVTSIREEIENLGGKVYFSTKFIDFIVENNQIHEIIAKNVKSNEILKFQTNHLLLCLGHSARDTFEMLNNKNMKISQKPFAMGVRIEQSQKLINITQYGKDDDRLPSADYKLVAHLPSGRSVFTFCMCPGGQVVASSSGDGEIVTNGMSNFARDGENANSALLVNVDPEDYNSSHPLAGIYFQAKFEKLAYELGGGNYCAPAQKVGEFLGRNDSKVISNNCKKEVSGDEVQTHKPYKVVPTYMPGIKFTQIEKCLPTFVTQSLREALPIFDAKLKGFASDENILVAIESRSSCPITLVRDESYQSSIKGIYPIGEGAGYAGGIISSAQDAIKVCESIYEKI